MAVQFIPLLVTLVFGAGSAGVLAVYLAWKLHVGEPNPLLGPLALPPGPEPEPASALLPEQP